MLKLPHVLLLGDTDDIVMAMNFFDETDEDKSDSSRGRPIVLSSAVPPLPSTVVPPLPSCLPPPASSLGEMGSSNSSYYLPSPRRDDDTASADEASEITDEDNACDITATKEFSKPMSRAKSVDRDSDYSELAPSQRRSNTKLSASLDSIPDSGLSTFNQETESHDVKAMIAGFERQIKVSVLRNSYPLLFHLERLVSYFSESIVFISIFLLFAVGVINF